MAPSRMTYCRRSQMNGDPPVVLRSKFSADRNLTFLITPEDYARSDTR